ncbi:MAG TPA: phosphopantothenoylcysteine decarboxylase [Chthoniobacterales bacterium]
MKAFVTCGPASEPIDAVRVITNRSTGELGALLAEALAAAQISVDCFRGAGATHPAPAGVAVRTFETNADLWALLDGAGESPDVIFHAAALCDFGGSGTGKIESRSDELVLRLSPLPKLLPKFRQRFPQARIVGWKFEVEGTGGDARANAERQLRECDSDLCVLNGPAIGAGFEVFSRDRGFIQAVRTKEKLGDFLRDWALSPG